MIGYAIICHDMPAKYALLNAEFSRKGKNIKNRIYVFEYTNCSRKIYSEFFESEYIQPALSAADHEEKKQETASLRRMPGSFQKIVSDRDYMKPWRDERGNGKRHSIFNMLVLNNFC